MNNEYPKYVNVKDSNGNINKMLYKDLIEHEKSIITDNVLFGYANLYSKKEVQDYKNEAYDELKTLKQNIRENNDVILVLNNETERYIVVEDLNSGKIKIKEKNYMVGTTVELEVKANSLEEAKDILYTKLKNMGLDVGDINGFEVPEDDE